MTTAILSALPEEQEGLAAQLDGVRLVRYAGRDFHLGLWHGRSVVFALSRIGKVAAATTAAALIERFGATRIMFTGVAGGLHPDVRVGDTVIGTEFLQHDMDASPLFPRHEVPLYGRSRFPADGELVGLLLAAARSDAASADRLFDDETRARFGLESPRVHQGLLISGDRFVSRAEEAHALRQALPQALAVEMEAAAVAQVCHDHGVPFAAVRNISDRADDQAHVDFPAYLAQVAGRQARALIAALLPTLPT
ncbi:5'-methylthioadenosine/adenosylhomocysteine nucleosidase [Variovorax sp. J22R133]|uniref:5'-methylthioadenosine/adenosylhomocysteine nucleosidase n=1 Tax=Variovorax brevis TaxID=3053503 RepID=UPI0025775363|nr:5'-methylthioadenosine/adenosylhomocysteine nucleosidase [Variovorax sp. J22R133]MDM0115502.1 5'-methylthioadenosine/adenosylhomocysteine nucleosidase [Variovorax sp. J22R133]